MKITEGRTYITTSGARVMITTRTKVGKLWIYKGYEVDRSGHTVSDWLMWKSDGKDWAGMMGNNITREADTGMKLDDASAVILERLIEACETDRALPGRVGPKAYGNAMPTTIFTDTDVWVLEVEEQIANEGRQTRERNAALSVVTERRALCAPDRISRMDEALGWLRLVIDPEARQVLIAYASCKASGNDWGQYLEARNRRNRPENVWVKRTIYRKITKTLQEVETKLRNTGIILRDCGGLPVAQQEAKHSCKSISSDLRVQRDDDLNRPLPMLNPAA